MRSNQQDIELLEAYLRGELSEEQRVMVEVRLKNEIDLMTDFEEIKTLSDGIRLNTLQRKASFLRELESNIHQHQNKSTLKWWKWGLILLLVTLLLISGLYLFKKDATENLTLAWSDEVFYTYIFHQTSRNSEPDPDSKQTMAYNLFTIKDFSGAKPLLEELWEEQSDTLALFYLGITEISLGNCTRGIEILSNEAIQNYPVVELKALCK